MRKVVPKSLEKLSKAQKAVQRLRKLATPLINGERGGWPTGGGPGCILMRAYRHDEAGPGSLIRRLVELGGPELVQAHEDVIDVNDATDDSGDIPSYTQRRRLDKAVTAIEKAVGLK